jgi:hypothetical protein
MDALSLAYLQGERLILGEPIPNPMESAAGPFSDYRRRIFGS